MQYASHSFMYATGFRVKAYSRENSRHVALQLAEDSNVEIHIYFGDNDEAFRQILIAFADEETRNYDND